MPFSTLRTPLALLDLERVERNCRAMSRRVTKLGVKLRPHIKTHKCIEVATRQTRDQFGGITVATLEEAAWFGARGFSDITWAVPLAPARAAEAVALGARLDAFQVLVDSLEAAHAIAEAAEDAGRIQSVLLKVDCGYGRAGVDPSGVLGPCLAEHLSQSPAIHFAGILAHGGHSYGATTFDEVREVAAQERDVTVGFAKRLRDAGLVVETVSIGSTPTCVAVDQLAGVTEVRPGNYAYFDAFQTMLGSCTLEDCAFSVLTTVIGCYPERRVMLVDAGSLALSADVGPRHVDEACGHGVVLDASGSPLSGYHLEKLSQEHGRIVLDPDATPLPVGSRLRIVPNHSCLAAALYDRVTVLTDGLPGEIWSTSGARPGR